MNLVWSTIFKYTFFAGFDNKNEQKLLFNAKNAEKPVKILPKTVKILQCDRLQFLALSKNEKYVIAYAYYLQRTAKDHFGNKNFTITVMVTRYLSKFIDVRLNVF